MGKQLKWDQVGEHFYETGVSKGVLYPMSGNTYQKGVAWNGLTSINENPSGAEATNLYADNTKYLVLRSNEDFGATIEAYTYPDEFAACDGSASLTDGVVIAQQSRTPFGMSYRTEIGNDSDGTDCGYKIHLIYGATAYPSQKQYQTINDNPEAMTLSWEISTVPVEVPGFKPTAHLIIDSTTLTEAQLTAIEAKLYGSESEDPTLPLPAEVKTIIEQALGA